MAKAHNSANSKKMELLKALMLTNFKSVRRESIVQLWPRLKQSLSLSLGPKITLKLLSTPPPPTTTTLNFLTSSRHSRRLKLGIKLNQTKLNPNLKKKKISKKISTNVLKY